MRMNELLNGNYFIYQIIDGGCGIVKAVNAANAAVVVANAYYKNTGATYDTDDITIYPLDDGNHYFAGIPNVIELGWSIEMN